MNYALLPFPPMTHLLRTLLLLWSTCSSAALQLQVLGHPNNNYTALVNTIQQFNQDIIVLQSRNPDASTIEDDHLLLMPGHSFDLNNKGNQHILVLAGELDGVFRFSNFASALHIHRQTPRVNFVVVQGAAHYSFATPTITAAKLALDLQPEITNAVAQQTVATVVKQWLNPQRHGNKDYTAARLRALQLATPIVKALQLEGSAHTGQDICNSDFPTNPTCNSPSTPFLVYPLVQHRHRRRCPPKNAFVAANGSRNMPFPVSPVAMKKDLRCKSPMLFTTWPTSTRFISPTIGIRAPRQRVAI